MINAPGLRAPVLYNTRLLHLPRLGRAGHGRRKPRRWHRRSGLPYDSSQYGDWSLLYSIWPVNGTAGEPSASRYERVVLYVQDGREASVRDPLTGVTTAPSTSLEAANPDRDFLTAFAREIIKRQKATTVQVPDGGAG